jgi:putative ABC transport system permease protein
MSIVLKHIVRNIRDKKLMSALIVAALALSGTLLFVALSISDALETVAGNDYESAQTVFLLIFLVTAFMSVFVVYSSFKYIMALRIKTLGTLRSVGADKRRCRRLLLLESGAYGFLAALLAAAAGVGLLAVLAGRLSGGKAELKISALNLALTVLFCLVLSPLCAYIPVKATEKYSVKEIILQTRAVKEKKVLPKLVAGLVLIGAGATLTRIGALRYETGAVVAALLLTLAGFTLCAAPLVRYAAAALSKIFPDNFAVKNMRNNAAHANIAVLLAIAVAVVFMINGSNAILVKVTDDSFKLYNYDIQVSGAGLDGGTIEKMREVNGVEGAAGIYYKAGAAAENRLPLANLYGMDADTAREFFRFTADGGAAGSSGAADGQGATYVLTNFGEKQILLSRDYTERENLRVGDTVGVNGADYTIAGILNEMLNSGNVGIIGAGDFRISFGAENYTFAAVKSASPDAAAAALREAFPDCGAATVAQMLARAKAVNADMLTTLDYVVVLSTTAGVFGVLNNLLIAFNAQKRERALLRSIGLSRRRGALSQLAEALFTGLTGGGLGLLGGALLVSAIPAVLVVFEFPAVSAPFSLPAAALCLGCSLAVCLSASLISLVGNARINIMQVLRQEIL